MLEHRDMFFERRVTAGWANLAHLMHISVPEVADWAVAALGALYVGVGMCARACGNP